MTTHEPQPGPLVPQVPAGPKFQYISDLHLEMRRFRIRNVTAPYLILAGDIGDPATEEYVAFLKDCSAKYKHIFVVLGNHEGYHRTWAGGVAAARRSCAAAGPNVHLLHRDRFDLDLDAEANTPNPESAPALGDKEGTDNGSDSPARAPGGSGDGVRGVRIVGATLWSRLEGPSARCVAQCLTDFYVISGMYIATYNEMHDADLAWLRAEVALAEVDGRRLLVMTHHAPTRVGASHPKYHDSDLASAFATDVEHPQLCTGTTAPPPPLLLAPVIRSWVYGHTHFCNRRTLPTGALLVSNQHGYRGEEEDCLFDEGATFDLPV